MIYLLKMVIVYSFLYVSQRLSPGLLDHPGMWECAKFSMCDSARHQNW
jgi:hypothetical protein